MLKFYFIHPEKPDDATKLYYIKELVNCMKQTFSSMLSKAPTRVLTSQWSNLKGGQY